MSDDLKSRMDKVVKVLNEALAKGAPSHGLYRPDRMRSWSVPLPDDPEITKMFRGIMIDNLGGVTIALAGPAIVSLADGDYQLMGGDSGSRYCSNGNSYVRLELRPLVPLEPEKKP